AVVGDLAHAVDVPAVRLESLRGVVGKRQLRGTVDGDVVVVIDVYEPPELQVTGQRRGFVADAFHHVAVAADDEGVVIAHLTSEARSQELLGDRHPDAITESLAQRPGRHLEAPGVLYLRVPRRLAAELPEGL